MNIAEFAFSEATINKIFKEARLKILFNYAITILAVCVMANPIFKDLKNENNFEPALYALLFMFFSMSLVFYLSHNKNKNKFKTYVLLITDTEIIREQQNTPEIRHLKTDITEIIKNHNGDLFIKAHSIKDMIGVSAKIDNYAELEVLLNQIKPIKANNSNTFIQRFPSIITLASLVTAVLFFTSNNFWVIEITGIILSFCMIYYFFIMYNNKNMDKMRRWMLIFMIFPLLSIIGKMYLMAFPKNVENKEISNNNGLNETEKDELLKTIEIHLKVPKEEEKDFENGLRNGISLENMASEIKDLDKPDEIVLTNNKVLLEIDYPLNKPYKNELKSFKNGFTRKELLLEIGKRYKQIYAEEEASTTTKIKPVGERGNTVNRNETDGKYGIWGHDLSDLWLMDIEVYRNKEGQIILRLTVDS